MSQWVIRGLTTGVKTSPYPAHPDTTPGVTPGLPRGGVWPAPEAEAIAARCPSQALRAENGQVVVDYRRCVHAFRCVREGHPPLGWNWDYEWAAGALAADPRRLGPAFGRSVHILIVDAGDCGACLHEVKQLNNPYYNLHRLGFFITPTPRHADLLLVVGPVTDHMRVALEKAYDAMPTPKRVMAVGACALSGGVFGPSFVSEGGVARVLPVDLEVPGQPPPPLTILHGLLLATGRAAPARLLASAPASNPEVALP